MSESDCVRVALRIRPLVKSEIDKGCQEVVEKVKNEPQVIVQNHDSFTFNYVFGQNDKQKSVYEEAVESMIEKLFKGYNVTILAYGQTGSGKTHTMGTAFNGEEDELMGVIPRAVSDIFNTASQMSSEYQVSITCSFMELYQENLYDLLSPASRDQSVVDIREDTNKGIIVPGLTEISVASANETTHCLIKGSAGRAVAATAMNEQSSRSHAIFTINLNIVKNNQMSTMTTARFNLVDLAGSERSKKTKATGERFKEGVNINKGLLALGNVISALGSGQNSYVCYRDSKLTRLLQDSLGGNSITLMIACVSPADYNLEETISTLRYADRARKIKNKPVINMDPQQVEINKLNNIIQNLRLQLLGRSNGSLSNIIENSDNSFDLSSENAMLKKQNKELNEKNQQLRQQLQTTLNDVTEIELRASIAEETHDKLLSKFNEVKQFLLQNANANLTKNDENKENDINKIRSVMDEIDNIFKENQEELMSQKSENNSINEVTFCVQQEDVQIRYDQFTTKQLEINNEIRKINRELALKESHHQKVSVNLTKFCDYQGTSESLIKESESKIQALEAEKDELMEKLKSIKENVSAKLAEERRKRLQQLEHEITDLRKKILQQDKLLKVREKEAQKILNLNNEIQQMKAAKVNLIKTMKKEAESFRQWKLNREKQLTQLKEKDRKRQNEMARMEALHNKQKNVLKRKVEEANAVNKRLKDILDKQKQVQLKRNTSNVQTGKMEHIVTLIDHELELILSVVDAQNTLDQLMEDRASINNRLKDLKTENSNENKKEINSINNELSLRNAQINDLQHKIVTSDIMGKIKLICDSISNLPEARGALKHLFNALIDLRKEFAVKDNKIEEYKSLFENAEEKNSALEAQSDEEKNKYREEILNTEKYYEDKITVLLTELNKSPEHRSDINEQTFIEKLPKQEKRNEDELLEELNEFKKKCAEYEILLKNKNRTKKMKDEIIKEENDDEEDLFDDDEDEYESESELNESDPDWIHSPMFRRRSKAPQKLFGTKNSLIMQNTFEAIGGIKRISNGTIKCGCKTNCKTKRCSCRINQSICSDRCACSDECVNTNSNFNNTESTISESTNVTFNAKDGDKNYVTNTYMSSNENVNTLNETKTIEVENTAKKIKLLEEDDSLNGSDVRTPKYPFKIKQRRPFF